MPRCHRRHILRTVVSMSPSCGNSDFKVPGKLDRFLRHPATPFLVPAVIYLFALTIYPFLYSVIASLFDLSLTNPRLPSFVGLENYQTLLTDSLFYTGLLNTLLITVVSVTIEFAIGFSVAHLFVAISDIRGSGVLRTIYILPMMVTPVVAGLLWSYILDPLFGVMNYLLQVCGIAAQPWFSAPESALRTVVFVNVWQWNPFLMLISIAGLVSIPKDLYEAAQIDGAKWYHIVAFVELPMIRNTILIGVIFRIIDCFRLFDIVYASTRGGPGRSTEVISLYAYRQIFQYFNAGYGSAAAVVILIIAILLANIAIRFLGREGLRA
jgi:multiple sugar transport system permease protein